MADEKKSTTKNSPIPIVTPNVESTEGTLVKIINKHPIDGKYIVVTKDGIFYLIPTDELKYSYNFQSTNIDASTEKPYPFDAELSSISIANRDRAKTALYQSGIVSEKFDNKEKFNRALFDHGITLKVKQKE